MGPMTTTHVSTVTSHYQAEGTAYADLALSGHEIVNDLHRRARSIAPRFAEECADTGCTNLRPSAEYKNRRKAWDMIAEAHTWNLLADDSALVIGVKNLLRSGMDVQVSWSYEVGAAEIKVRDGADWVFPFRPTTTTTPEPATAEPSLEDLAQAVRAAAWKRVASLSNAQGRDLTELWMASDGTITATVTADALRPGDVVVNYGMVIVITAHWTPSWERGDDAERVWINHGVVVNPDDTDVRSLVGNLMFDRRQPWGHQAHWNCQGNRRATYRVLLAGPGYNASASAYNALRPSLHPNHFAPIGSPRDDAQSLAVQDELFTCSVHDTSAAQAYRARLDDTGIAPSPV